MKRHSSFQDMKEAKLYRILIKPYSSCAGLYEHLYDHTSTSTANNDEITGVQEVLIVMEHTLSPVALQNKPPYKYGLTFTVSVPLHSNKTQFSFTNA